MQNAALGHDTDVNPVGFLTLGEGSMESGAVQTNGDDASEAAIENNEASVPIEMVMADGKAGPTMAADADDTPKMSTRIAKTATAPTKRPIAPRRLSRDSKLTFPKPDPSSIPNRIRPRDVRELCANSQ